MVRCIGRHDGDPPQAEPGLMLCHRCRRNLGRHLADISDLWALLSVIVVPGSGTSGGHSGGHSGNPGSRPPCRIDVLDITDPRGAVSQQLVSWARVVIEDRQLSPRSLDGEQAARLLAIHADWIAAQPWCDEAAAEIHDCAWRIRRVCGDLPDPPIGTCPDIDPRGESDTCGGPLRWMDGSVSVVCGRCGSAWRADDLVNVGRVSPLKLWESVSHVAAMLDMSDRTLRHWVMTGKVRRNGFGQVNHGDVWRHAHRKDA